MIIEQKIISCLVEIVANIHKNYWTFLIQIMPVKLRLGMKIIQTSGSKSGPWSMVHGSEVHSRKRLFYKDKISMPKWKVIWLISLVVVLVATPQIISLEGNREHKARPIKTSVVLCPYCDLKIVYLFVCLNLQWMELANINELSFHTFKYLNKFNRKFIKKNSFILSIGLCFI